MHVNGSGRGSSDGTPFRRSKILWKVVIGFTCYGLSVGGCGAQSVAQGAFRIGSGLEVARSYEFGEGVEKDLIKAADLYCRAAREGNAEALYSLGWMYANGRGVGRDDGYASTLFSMAAFLGHEHAGKVTKFVGEYLGIVPECLKANDAADQKFDVAQYMSGMSEPRRKVVELVLDLAPKFEIDPKLALAIVTVESNFNSSAVSPKNAIGVMQLIPATAERFNVKNPFDASDNVKGGLAYLRWLLAYFKGDVALAAAGYNAGEGAVDRYRGIPPFRETRGYVEKIQSLFTRSHHPYNPSLVAPSKVFVSIELAGK
ncbi:MAG: transglycosylase SLT domain-containing protein [Zoogloeaceae bacterium]|nr:transglycosylase SLT domain-containing protein [Zoogloeaceae bacterium]